MKRTIQVVVSLVIGFGLLWLLFRGTEWSEFYDSMRSVRPLWIAVAMIPVMTSIFTRVQRWSYIVRAVQPDATYRSMFSATQIGFLVNFTIALRIGEPVRALVLSRLAKLSFSKSMALAVLDRVTDLIGLIVVIFIASMSFHATRDISLPAGTFGNAEPIPIASGLIQGGAVVATAGLVSIVVLVMLYVNQGLVLRLTRRVIGFVSSKAADWVCGMFEQFADGLHVFRSASDMAKSIAYSLITWACFVVAMICFMRAFGISGPWYTPFVVQSLLAVFVSAPGVPGLVGQFHVPIVAALVMCVPDVDVNAAKAVALSAHFFNLVPIAASGILCLYIEKLSFLEVTRAGVRAQDDAHQTAHSPAD